MAAQVRWNEYNGPSGTETTGITNLNFGSVDQPNLNPAHAVVERGTNSYDKWIKIEFYGGTFNRVSEFKFWRCSENGGDGPPLPPGVYCRAEAGYSQDLTYSQPTRNTLPMNECPNSYANALNVGPAELTGYGKTYFIHLQVQTTEQAPTGDVPMPFFKFMWKEE
jgi:hypothetical protein